MNGDGEVIYRIDGNDTLVAVNDRWDAFALQNDSPHLIHENVVNRNLWTFIQDADTQQVYRTLFKRLRRKRRILKLPFRCDSPTLRRYMEMDLLALERGAVELHCRLIKVEARAPVPLASSAQPSRPDGIRMCSWCKKVEVGNGHWVEVEDALVSLRLLECDPVPPTSHVMCDICLEDLGVEAR